MSIHRICNRLLPLWVACTIGAVSPMPAAAGCEPALTSLVRLAADRVDAVLGEVAASTRALGKEFLLLAERPAAVSDGATTAWQRRAETSGNTTGFRTWPAGSPPRSRTPYPGFYSYRGETITKSAVAHLQVFEKLVPVFRSAYRSFDFSWVYLTTSDDMLLVYPYVAMDEAVHNEMPTSQVFYKAADFRHRDIGWTAPYLDLVGAGMMITVSYPVFSGDRLLGVTSRDITLKQLSRSVLAQLADAEGTSALIIDGRGLAIDATQDELAAEIVEVNSQAGAAVLYLRNAGGLETLGDKNAAASALSWIDEIGEQVLANAAQSENGRIGFEAHDRHILAARIAQTGWFVVLIRN